MSSYDRAEPVERAREQALAAARAVMTRTGVPDHSDLDRRPSESVGCLQRASHGRQRRTRLSGRSVSGTAPQAAYQPAARSVLASMMSISPPASSAMRRQRRATMPIGCPPRLWPWTRACVAFFHSCTENRCIITNIADSAKTASQRAVLSCGKDWTLRSALAGDRERSGHGLGQTSRR
jgi:hypothetical protein